ncbi:sodium/hydrogen exchanger 9B2-like [Neolamprologus brichardi]|uniref:sodium/hydrogen exchanger 9B2-like n=1 Tax=Neolamprologus brichardi TaxID=32507 RepID=UPI001643EE7F|nr:sodium/hydrogen exchanger 9B2-like [Neolamprologus brichardi]
MPSSESPSSCCASCISLKDRCPRPQGLVNLLITKVCLFALLFGVVWSITGKECLPGGNLFGIIILFICSVLGGKLVGMIQLPTLPPFPPLLGMLLAGLLLRNVPYVTDAIFIDTHWSAALRNIALSIILTRAGLGLNPEALSRLKAVCVRVAVGPCMVEACTAAVVSHFLLGLPWVWGFILGFVLAAVSPAVVFPSMLLLQREGYGVEKVNYHPLLSSLHLTDERFILPEGEDLVLRRTLMLLGLSTFSVFTSNVIGFSGAGSLCTLVLAFLAALGWKTEKAPVAEMVGRSWDVFQPLLFGLIGAEITIKALSPSTVGLGMACILIGLVIRLLVTFLLVHYGGFNLKEKLFISVAWLPKATVQAAIGSKALDMARKEGDEALIKFGLDVLTLAVLAILTTAPVGALGIGLAGPRLLARQVKASLKVIPNWSQFFEYEKITLSCDEITSGEWTVWRYTTEGSVYL